jgi:hypothetical protein
MIRVDWGAAWTDAVLAMLACVVGARCVLRGGRLAGIGGLGLLLIGVVAALGAVRFSVAPGLAPIHMPLARFAGIGVIVAAGSGALLLRRDRVASVLVILGAVPLVLGGVAIAGEGSWAGLSRVGWFHLAMAAVCLLLGLGLQRADPRRPVSSPE